METLERKELKAYPLLLLAQLMVAICVVSAKFLLGSVSSGMILTLRFSVASLLLFFLSGVVKEKGMRIVKELSRRDLMLIFFQALCAGALFNGFLLWGLHHTTAAQAGIVISTLPVIVALFGVLFLRDTLKKSTIVCVVLAMIGLMVVHYHPGGYTESPHLFGDLLVLLALVPEALYYIIARMYDNKVPVFFLAGMINVINVPLCALLLLFHPEPLMGLSFMSVFMLVISGLASGFFYVLWYLGSRYTKSPLVGLTTAFPPVAILFLAAFFLHEPITPLKVLGMCIILVAIAYPILLSNKKGNNKS